MRSASTPRKRPPTRDVGRKLRDLRKARNLTQSDLAARIGIQQSDLCRMENGQYRVNLDTLVKILSEFQVTFAEFFQEETGGDLNPDEAALVRRFRALSDVEKEEVRRFVRFLQSDGRRPPRRDS